MPQWEIKAFGGVIPRTDNRLIQDYQAVEAVNCDLTGGQLVGLPQPFPLVDLSGMLPVVERAYRITSPIPPAGTPVNPPVNSGPPKLSNYNPWPGLTVTCDMGLWSEFPTSYAGEWLRDGISVGVGNAYLVTTEDLGHTLLCRVTATNILGSTSADSNVVTVSPEVISGFPVSVIIPQIHGDNTLGSVLTCDQGTWYNSPTSFSYQWFNLDKVEIAVGSSYTVQTSDVGRAVYCTVTATNVLGTVSAPPSGYFFIPGEVVVATARDVVEGPWTVWLPLPSRFSSVVRSPLANDTYRRIYWTNPGDISPHVNTEARIRDGLPNYDLGIIAPTTAPVVVSTTGGTPPPDVLPIDRSYVYTYVNSFNEESAPSPASDIFSGPPDALWTVDGFPTAAPANPSGRNYPPVTGFNIYRTITSATAGAQFYFVVAAVFAGVGGTPPLDIPGTFLDNYDVYPDSKVVLNEVLETTGWKNPPDYLDGLVAMAGGFLAGFTGNTVHFSEPNRPHTWPEVYDQSAHYDIVVLAVTQQYLAILTKGYPSVGSGNMPANIMLTQTQAPEPCISRGSMVVDLSGVFFASQNGLVLLTGYGTQLVTAQVIEKNEWLQRYRATKLVACRHRTQYMAVNETDTGFLIDYAEARLGVEDLSTMAGVVCVWNDEYTGDTLMCSNGVIYEWDNPDLPAQIYRWKSKQFFTQLPISLGAAQVELDPAITGPAPSGPVPLDNGDPAIQLPPGINAQFRYYAGPRLELITTRDLTQPMEIFRLPNGFRCFDHQVEVVSRVPIASIQLATTLNELKLA